MRLFELSPPGSDFFNFRFVCGLPIHRFGQRLQVEEITQAIRRRAAPLLFALKCVDSLPAGNVFS
jgi:hypothetical protein